MRGERSGHTLQPTALVHEAYLRLVGAKLPYRDRIHFFSVAALAMRRVLVDHARARRSSRRGGGALQVSIAQAAHTPAGPAADVVDLDQALSKLGAHDAATAEAAELRYFGGLTLSEIAGAQGISSATVQRRLRFARAWLQRELGAPAGT